MKVTQALVLANLPQKLAEKLMPFQRDGVEYAVNKNGRCLIADEMGLGKTIQAISVAYYYKEEWPLLIIVPSSLRYCWIEEFEKWLPEINPGDINLIQSGSDASGINSARVTIVTFGLLSKATTNIVREALMAKAFQVVIVDESHYIRNIKTISAKTVVPLVKNANRRILLSGTPALARPVELYPQIDAISPNTFGSWYSYTARYCDAKLEWIGKMKRRNVNGASNLEELQQKLSSTLMIRREKSTVLTQLPPKQRQKILFELKQSELTKEIRKTFEELRPLLKKGSTETFEVLTGAGDDVKDTNMLSLIQRLYQLSGEAKIGPAREYVEMLCENPKLKFLVFAYHRSMMNGLSQTLYDRNVKFIRIDGDTPPSERPQLVHQFQNDTDTRVAVLSILAAGVGLTLTAATVVVFAEMYWTPGVMVQCEDRAHRIGQSSCVAIHYLVAKDTMDEWVWSAVCKKTIVTSTTLTGKKQAMKADAGDRYQVDLLSSAEAWVPKDNNDLDLTSYFQTHQETDQKSILDYFSSSQKSSASSPRTPSRVSDSSQSLKSTPASGICTTPGSVKDLLHSPRNSSSKTCTTPQESREHSQYFTPTSAKVRSQSTTLGHSDRLNSGCDNPAKRAKTDSSHKNTAVVVINSDTDDDFTEASPPSQSRNKSSSGKSSGSAQGSKKRKRKESLTNKSKFKNRLLALWSKLEKDDDDCVEITNVADSDDDVKGDNAESHRCSDRENHDPCVRDESDKEDKKDTEKGGKAVLKPKTNSSKIEGEGEKSVSNSKTSSSKLEGEEIKMEIGTGRTLPLTSQWQCPTCTYLNYKELRYCEMCETPKKIKTAKEAYNGTSSEVTTERKENGTKSENNSTDSMNERLVEHHVKHKEKENSKNIPSDTEDTSQYLNDTKEPTEPVIDSMPNTPSCKAEKSVEEDVLKTPKITVKQVEAETLSPTTSLKKYRFKSLRKSVAGGDSPVVETVKTEKRADVSEVGVGTSEERRGCERRQRSPSQETEERLDNPTAELQEEVPAPGSGEEEMRVINVDNIPVHSMLKYQTSKYTGRVYLFTQDSEPLDMNFVPLDVEVGNLDALPELLLHPANLRLVQKFVREWQSLTETKRRLVIKAGRIFVSPVREYDDLRSCKTINTQRHQTKIDTAVAAKKAATSVNGSLRVISRSSGVKQATGEEQELETQTGVAQAVAEDGTPLCLQCHTPYTNELLQKSSIQSEDNAWQTRFCSQRCSHDYWMVTNSEYLRDKVYEAERGVCQFCQLDAHAFYRQVKDTPDAQKRAVLIAKSKFNNLAIKTKQQMTKKPVAGQFWHADHIVPVWEGGGQCDIDNLRTLCVMCHHKVTAKQASKRATVRKLGSAVNSGDITAFFQRS